MSGGLALSMAATENWFSTIKTMLSWPTGHLCTNTLRFDNDSAPCRCFHSRGRSPACPLMPYSSTSMARSILRSNMSAGPTTTSPPSSPRIPRYAPESLANEMYERWLEKGSRYPYIFREALDRTVWAVDLIDEMVSIFNVTCPASPLYPGAGLLLETLAEDTGWRSSRTATPTVSGERLQLSG